MLLQLLLFFAFAALATTLAMLIPGAARARIWVGLPLGVAALALASWLVAVITQDQTAGLVIGLIGAALTLAARLLLVRRWSLLGAQLLTMVVVASAVYLTYAAAASYGVGARPLAVVGSTILLLFELAALALAASYLFEILDVLSRREPALPPPPADYRPAVALQLATYNEPVEILAETLRSLAAIEYPRLVIQVVDNNTRDPNVWKPVEALCQELGPRFHFIHLEPWPGYKAGALNEATRRLESEIEVIGIVDADYIVQSDFLDATVGYFADPQVAIVQTPQDYRDWSDDGYLRGLYYSYRYFFQVTMPAREHRNAIIFAGTMGLIRRSVLDEIGGWDETIVTEDAEASLRMLGRGYRGVYVPRPFGQGMMPLTFDGLKKQRFRWALGGVQILRKHWRELLPLARHQLRLSTAQRVHYLLGSLQWFGDVLMVGFTVLLLATALAVALRHQLPVRQLTGAAIAMPLVFLISGVTRAIWAMRATTRCTWGDALRAMRVWFALSWIVALACLRGLVRRQMAFLRTPKHKEGALVTPLAALGSARAETLLLILSVAGALAMIVTAPSWGTLAVATLLLFQGAIYANAAWASFAAEGIKLTPERRRYLRSPQSTGDWPQAGRAPLLVPLAAVGAVAVLLVYAATLSAPSPEEPAPVGPQIGQLPKQAPPAAPAPSPSASAATPSPTSTARPSPSGSPSASPESSPTPSPRTQPTSSP